MIKPLNWAFPAIYSLPENCLEMLASPLPIISGIKCSYEYSKSNILPRYTTAPGSQDTIFVFLDHDYVFAQKSTVQSTRLPKFDNFFSKLRSKHLNLFNEAPPKTIKADLDGLRFRYKRKALKVKGNALTMSGGPVSMDLKNWGKNEENIFNFLWEIRMCLVNNLIDVLPNTLEGDFENVNIPNFMQNMRIFLRIFQLLTFL